MWSSLWSRNQERRPPSCRAFRQAAKRSRAITCSPARFGLDGLSSIEPDVSRRLRVTCRLNVPFHKVPVDDPSSFEAHGLYVTAAAKALGVSRPALSNLLNQNADLSGEMDLRIEKAFGVNMDTLMRM
jgi:hypothetical protein